MNKTEILSLIGKSAQEIIPGLEGRVLTEEDRLADLGLNSIDRAEVIMMVQEALNLSFPLSELATAKNAGELAARFHSKLNPA